MISVVQRKVRMEVTLLMGGEMTVSSSICLMRPPVEQSLRCGKDDWVARVANKLSSVD